MYSTHQKVVPEMLYCRVLGEAPEVSHSEILGTVSGRSTKCQLDANGPDTLALAAHMICFDAFVAQLVLLRRHPADLMLQPCSKNLHRGASANACLWLDRAVGLIVRRHRIVPAEDVEFENYYPVINLL